MIGKLKRVRLREGWKHEAFGFTNWLETNIDVLNVVLDFDLVSVQCEKPPGLSVSIWSRKTKTPIRSSGSTVRGRSGPVEAQAIANAVPAGACTRPKAGGPCVCPRLWRIAHETCPGVRCTVLQGCPVPLVTEISP